MLRKNSLFRMEDHVEKMDGYLKALFAGDPVGLDSFLDSMDNC